MISHKEANVGHFQCFTISRSSYPQAEMVTPRDRTDKTFFNCSRQFHSLQSPDIFWYWLTLSNP